jgi:hypothetical protein
MWPGTPDPGTQREIPGPWLTPTTVTPEQAGPEQSQSFTAPFATGQSALTAAGRGQVDQAIAAAMRYQAENQPGGSVHVNVVGRASPPWRRPGESTPEELNQRLAADRATVVASALRSGLPPGIQVLPSASPATGPNRPGPADPQNEVATIAVVQRGPAIPGTVTPGQRGPSTRTPARVDPSVLPPYLPDVFNNPSIGWDTTRSIGINTGNLASLAVAGSVGQGYAWPLGDPVKFGGVPGPAIRILVGVLKMGMDLVSGGDLLSLARDSIGTFGAFLPDAVVDGIVDTVVPMP